MSKHTGIQVIYSGSQTFSHHVPFVGPTLSPRAHRRIRDFFQGGSSKTSSSGCVLAAYQWRPKCSYTVNNHTHFG